MLIYICDDSSGDRKRLGHYIRTYEKTHGYSVRIKEFCGATEMLAQYGNGETPAIIFLDIYMDELDGMEAAKKIREISKTVSIVFTTSSADHAIEAFSVYADGYLHKPFEKEEFERAMRPLESKFKVQSKRLEFEAGQKKYSILFDELIYLEVSGHYVTVVTQKESFTVMQTMTFFEKALEQEKNFLKCGRAYLINLVHVEEAERDYVKMDNGNILHIPTRIQKSIRQQIQNWEDENANLHM